MNLRARHVIVLAWHVDVIVLTVVMITQIDHEIEFDGVA